MRILLFSHSSSTGGAENALFDLIDLLKSAGHAVEVIVPSLAGPLVDKLRDKGIGIGAVPVCFFLPNVSSAFLQLASLNVEGILHSLAEKKFDLIISNTMVTLQGGYFAARLGIPSICYLHEVPINGDLLPHGCSLGFYLSQLTLYSPNVICASAFVASQIPDNIRKLVLFPFKPYPEYHENDSLESSEVYALLVIGTRSRRKNVHFALTVQKSLRLRGKSVTLHLVGSENNGSFKVQQQLANRNEKGVYVHQHLENPYSIPGRKINLICSLSEPFGLTIPESLTRGIPAVSTRSGGPEELLPQDYLFDVDDLDACVRIIENIISDYQYHSRKAREHYNTIVKSNQEQDRRQKLEDFLAQTINHGPSREADKALDPLLFRQVIAPPVSVERIIKNIVNVSKSLGGGLSETQVAQMVTQENATPGVSVLADTRRFDVVPFACSDNMERLYSNGFGPAIELLANINDHGRKFMLGYIVLALHERAKIPGNAPRVLCLGDGLGIDSIILSSFGFDVDYVDLDNSVMGKIAALNIEDYCDARGSKSRLTRRDAPLPPYDAVVALEINEHVPDTERFIGFAAENLETGGLLFISECFDGIYDRWPTHLYRHEHQASQLPFIALEYFELVDVNTAPYGKPYLLKKRDGNISVSEITDILSDSDFLNMFLSTKSKLGF